MKIALLTSLALIAFAGNSVLCRLALGEGAIDAASFTSIRLMSGVLTLWLILRAKAVFASSTFASAPITHGSWLAGLMLFIYAAGFSYAYVSLDTGTGALILFAAVQMTIIAVGLLQGNRLTTKEWLGVLIAFAGFVYLVLPSVSTPSLSGFILMSLAGVAWGFYTLSGKSSQNPLQDTAYNFLRTLPFVVVLILVDAGYSGGVAMTAASTEGLILAILSGALASAVGYTIWYMALSGLSTTQSASVQLLVPVIAAAGGVVFAGEALTSRLIIASLLILGGILFVIFAKERIPPAA